MTPNPNKNKQVSSVFYAIVEVGDTLFFDKIQKYFKVTHFEGERPHSNDVDLFEMDKQYGTPIVFSE